MHRVELKDTSYNWLFYSKCIVPNAPCGVESGLPPFPAPTPYGSS